MEGDLFLLVVFLRRGGVSTGGGGGQDLDLFEQPLGYVLVGDLDLLVTGTGVGELIACVGVVQVLPDGRQVFGDVEAPVLLGHHLETRTDGCYWNISIGEVFCRYVSC